MLTRRCGIRRAVLQCTSLGTVEGKEDLETQGHQLLYISNHPRLLAYMRINVEISVPDFDRNSKIPHMATYNTVLLIKINQPGLIIIFYFCNSIVFV